MTDPHDTCEVTGPAVEQTPSLGQAAAQLLRNGGAAGVLLLVRDIVNVAAVRQRDLSDYAAVDGSAMLQIAYVGLCLCYVVYHLSQFRPAGAAYLLRRTPAWILFVYTGLCALSSLWSPDVVLTAYRSVECLCHLLLIVIVCDNLSWTCRSRQEMIEWLVTWALWVLIWDTLYFARMVRLGPMFFSIYIFRRGSFALGTLFFLTVFASRRKLFIAINLLYMPLSLANTTYFGVFFGLLGGLWAGDRRFQVAFFFLVGTIALVLLVMGPAALQHTLFYGQDGVGLEHTTGRDRMFLYALEYGMNRPLHGYGFVAGETSALWAQHLKAISAHNVFTSALLAIGVTGPILFIAFFAWLSAIVIRADLPDHWRPAFLGTVIMIFAVSSASPGLGTRVYGSWVPVVLASVGMCAIARWEHLALLHGAIPEESLGYGAVMTGQDLAG
ncbi:MAG TPA: hypothetical protein PLU87_03980 [Sedimentisphaerales bacterium]|nr:hypothetical protein [Sedimentisphaerales bacterium]HRS10245.1 hypothetical protein [Sedimentisphaerales bacterium]HRV46951.1 hypothetical protein [Sedimentisphaerales bacterium]